MQATETQTQDIELKGNDNEGFVVVQQGKEIGFIRKCDHPYFLVGESWIVESGISTMAKSREAAIEICKSNGTAYNPETSLSKKNLKVDPKRTRAVNASEDGARKIEVSRVAEKVVEKVAENPLTQEDKELIAAVVNKSDYSKHVEADHVITLWIDENNTVVVKMVHGYGRFNKEQFKLVLAEVKANLAPKLPTRRQQNQALADELASMCKEYGVTHSQIDWVSFSTSVFMGKRKIGEIGFGLMGFWFQGKRQKNNVMVQDIEGVIALLVARSVPVRVA